MKCDEVLMKLKLWMCTWMEKVASMDVWMRKEEVKWERWAGD